MTLLLKSSIEFVDTPSTPSASSSSSSSSSSSAKSPSRSHRFFDAAQLAADLLAMLFRSRAAVQVSAAESAASPAVAPPSPALFETHDHDDDDDKVDAVVLEDSSFDADYDYYCEPEEDAPHPADEEVEFSGAELHAFDLADRFDRLAPKTRHSGKRRPKIHRRRPAVHRPQVEHFRPSVREVTEAALAAPEPATPVPASAPVSRAPRTPAANDSWGSYRATPAAAAAEAARHIDASHARTCGLSPAQLTALMTRELSPADYELLLALDNAVKPKTIEEDSLAKLLLAVVAGDVAADDVCMICLDEMASAALSSLAKLPCKHVFHGACIREHLAKFSRRCPVDNLSLEN